MYENGRGVDISHQQANQFYEMAARQGHNNAQFNLGNSYYNGTGVDVSYKKAKELWMMAAEQGDAEAQSNIGMLYATGRGVDKSYEKAREWWLKSAKQGHELSIKGLKQLDEIEGRTTPSFIVKLCSKCNKSESSAHKLKMCPCDGAQYCDSTCQKKDWKNHVKEHRRLSEEIKLKNSEGEMKDDEVVLVDEEEDEEKDEKKEKKTSSSSAVEEEAEEEENWKKEKKTSPPPQRQEEDDVCPICMEELPKNYSKIARMICCVKGMHKSCCDDYRASEHLSLEQKKHLCFMSYTLSKDKCTLKCSYHTMLLPYHFHSHMKTD